MRWHVNTVSDFLPAACSSRYLLFFVFMFATVYGASSYAAPVLLVGDNTEVERLDTLLDVLDNAGQGWQADSIIKPEVNSQFTPLQHNVPAPLAAYSSNLWLRFTVINQSEQTRMLWFTLNHRSVQSVELYRRVENSLQPVMPAPVQNPVTAPFLKTFDLLPGERSEFYLQVKGLHSHALQPMLLSPSVYFNEQLKQYRQASFGVGMLLLNALLCLALALSRKSRLFLYQAGFVLSVALVQLVGLGMPEIGLGILQRWQYSIAFVFVYLACVSVLLISRETLHMHGLPVRRQKQLNSVLLFVHIGFLLLLVTTAGYSPLVLLLIAVVLAAIVVAGFYCYNRTGDVYTLAVTCVKITSGLFLAAYFLYNHSWIFIQLIDAVVLYVMVVETVIITLIYILAEYYSVSEAANRQRLMDKAELESNARTALLEEISHDIRTPVSNIIGVSDLLKDSALSVGQAEKINMISESAQLMLNQLAEFQSRAQSPASGKHPQYSPFELTLLIETCVQSFQMKAENRSCEMIVHIQPDVPDVVYGDQVRIRQILLQLIADAVDRTRQGEIVVKISRQASNPDAITLAVQDSAQLLAEKHGQQSQKDVVDSDIYSAVNQLLRAMDSRLCYSGDATQGNLFYFDLTLPAMKNPDVPDKTDDGLLRDKRLLVVDDNHASCKVLKQQAAAWGMQVTEAYDGSQAVATFRARQNLNEPFDVIILDYDMPQLSGIEAAARISAAYDTPPLMIMLTGLTTMPSEEAIREAGIAAVLNKPASPKLIRLTLVNLLSMRRQDKSMTGSVSQCKLLVVDDNDVSRRVVSKMLDALSVSYRLASDGKLACDAVKREEFDLILMDCEMPLMDGFEATHRIHQWQQQRNQQLTPIVAMTAHTMSQYQSKSREAGMAGFLGKPVHLNELREIILRHAPHARKNG